MADYTPTTDEVRLAYAQNYVRRVEYHEAGVWEFDRWLAALDAERDALAQQIAAVRAWNDDDGEPLFKGLDAILAAPPVTPESEKTNESDSRKAFIAPRQSKAITGQDVFDALKAADDDDAAGMTWMPDGPDDVVLDSHYNLDAVAAALTERIRHADR